MKTLRIYVDVPSNELIRWYRGEVTQLLARSDSGLRISLPVSVMRRFVGTDGLEGWFLLSTDENNRFVSLRQIGSPRVQRGVGAT